MINANDINIAVPSISTPKTTAFKGVTMSQQGSYEPPSDGGTKILLGLTAVAASVIAGLALHKSVKLGKVAEELKVAQNETKSEVQKLSQKTTAEPIAQAPAAIQTQTEQAINQSTTDIENAGKVYIPKHEIGSEVESGTSAISTETQNLYTPKHESFPSLEEAAPVIEAEIPSTAKIVASEMTTITLIEKLQSDLVSARRSLNEAKFSYSIAKNSAKKDPDGFRKAATELEAAKAKVKSLEDKISSHKTAQARLSETAKNLRDANFNLQIAQNCEKSKPGVVRKAQIDLRLAQAQHGRAKAQVARFNRPVNQ